MCRTGFVVSVAAVALAVVWVSRVQGQTIGGLYQITSGRYSECCGIVGLPTGYNLPDPRQSYIRFAVDPQSGIASMSFLSDDAQTVFSTIPCPAAGAIDFSFDYGFSNQDSTFFHVDPGPPPYGKYWSYGVTNTPYTLVINGILGTAMSPCADVPTRFNHSNVVAVLVVPPRLTILGASVESGARLFLQGHAGQTNVIEASTDLVSWVPVSTNVMDYSLCPICPYVIFEDPATTNYPVRFYRAFEIQ